MGLTVNNSPTFLSSGDPYRDFFFHVVPDTSAETINRLLTAAWDQDPLTALKLVCHLCGVRGTGKSDRNRFYSSPAGVVGDLPRLQREPKRDLSRTLPHPLASGPAPSSRPSTTPSPTTAENPPSWLVSCFPSLFITAVLQIGISILIAFCALSESGDMIHARRVFTQFPEPNTFMWNTMIRGYTRTKSPDLGLIFFSRMLHRLAEIDNRTFVFALKACEQFLEASVGEGIHCLIYNLGFDYDLLVQNGLVPLYVKHGPVDSARKLFDRMLERDVVFWTTMIDGYAQNDVPHEALNLFYVMLSTDIRPNAITMIAVLSACSQTALSSLGRSLHGYVEKSLAIVGLILQNALVDTYGKCGCMNSAKKVFDIIGTSDVFSWTSMMGAYAKCGNLDTARQIFDEMPERNVVTWSSMIAAYSRTDRPRDALNLFHEMIARDVKPIDVTLVSVLPACAQFGCLDLGRWIYGHYIKLRKIELSVKLANAFIDMYAKCGAIDAATELFSEMPRRDIVSWNSMIIAYAVHGDCSEALALFEQMKNMGVVPDDITFVGILSACNHGGLVGEGHKHFGEMKMVFGLEPKHVHYACLIDLLGRAGLLQDAYEFVRNMPIEPDETVWGALLNACRIHSNTEIGKSVGDKLIVLDSRDSGSYVLLSNMYAAGNNWADVRKVRRIMRDKGVKKTPGLSSIEVDGNCHEFLAADISHLLSREIYMIFDTIYSHLRLEGYVPRFSNR